MSSPFFKNHGPLKLSDIVNILKINIEGSYKDTKIHDIRDLVSSTNDDITFFHSKKYKDFAKKTQKLFSFSC